MDNYYFNPDICFGFNTCLALPSHAQKRNWRVTLQAQKKVDEKRKAERQAAKWLDVQPTIFGNSTNKNKDSPAILEIEWDV